MTTIITWLMGESGPWVAGLLLALFAGLAIYARGRGDGSLKEKLRNRKADHEAANDLRRNVDRNLDQRVREMEGRG